MQYIIDLPISNGYSEIFTALDKFMRLMPLHMGDGSLLVAEVALLFFPNIVCWFRLQRVLLHDRYPQFTTNFWCEL